MTLLKTRRYFFSRNSHRFKYFWPFILSKQFISYLGKWEIPQGYDTGITIYNSAVSKKVPLILKTKDLATWYICGPTVYAESHIGHASCYVKFDIIRRILEKVFNINVLLLLGVTDIDDKIIKKSNEAGINAFQLARKFELDFFQDMDVMRVLPPTIVCHVSKNIPLIISFCEKLIEKEYAYVTSEGNVYFIVSKGVTADLLHEIPDEIAQVQTDPLKKDPRDFALWKAAKPDEPFWESPWGNGRPGWHIECSAMASEIFGSRMDLHSGGSDLLFPHHSNEVSQSKAYHDCSQWVNYWLHSGLLHVDEELKMSKSVGNTISIKDFLKEHCVNDFRILCLQSRYRKNIIYSSETLFGAKFLHKKIHAFFNECESFICGEIKGPLLEEEKLLSKLAVTKEQVTSYLKADFNTSKAILCLTDFIDDINKSLPVTNTTSSIIPSNITTISSCYLYVNAVLEVFGIVIVTKKSLPKELVFFLNSVVEFRNKIRLLALNAKTVGNGIPASSYVDNVYKVMQTELDVIYESKVYPKLVTDLLQCSKDFFEVSHQIAETLDSNKTLNVLDVMKAKNARKVMAPLFKSCDEFRSVLNRKGVEIKDRGNFSTWTPLMELQKELCNSI